MVLIGVIITISYLILIASFIYGFDKVKSFSLENLVSKTTFSVIIPFRNEAKNLPYLLNSIDKLEYPINLFEIIFIDDDSEDDSVKIIEAFIEKSSMKISITKNNRNSNSPKKDAITTAINYATHTWIITTDADCILPKYWLESFDEFIQNSDTKCIAAPVTYYSSNNFIQRFQALELLSLQGATIGGFGINKPFLCNGANFAYKKEAFKELNGFEGNNNIASGDDTFLLEKMINKYPKQVNYLKCEHTIVATKAQPNWQQLISQRVRWASKTSAYNNIFGKLTGLIVLFENVMIVSGLVLSILGMVSLKSFIYLLIMKFSIDFLLIYKSASFFNQMNSLKSYLVIFLVYPFFSTYVAFISTFKSYKWKGRTFNK